MNKIKQLLRCRGLKAKDMAEALQLSETRMSQISNGASTTEETKRRICEWIGEPLWIVFPEDYPDMAGMVEKGSRDKVSITSAGGNSYFFTATAKIDGKPVYLEGVAHKVEKA